MPSTSNTAPKNKKKTARRTSRKRALAGPPLMALNKYPNQLPETVQVLMPYGDVWPLDCAAITYAQNLFRLNSIYDPDQTGVGGQPSGYNAYVGLYSRYKVIACDISVTFSNTCAQTMFGVVTVGAPQYHMPNTGTLVQQEALEGYGSKAVVLSPSGTSKSVGKVRMHADNLKIAGALNWADTDFSSLMGASPTLVNNMAVSICNVDGNTVAGTVTCVIQIDYFVLLSERHYTLQD